MSHLRTHTVEVGEVRRTTWDGRDHLVVPVVMIVEGVLNGELVTQEAMSDLPSQWDGRPVVINHPQERGVHVSANTPAQLEQAIGTVFNAHVDGNKLKAEMWIEVEKAADIVEAFEGGHVMEVSTGYFAGTIPTPGTFNGNSYDGIQTDIRPDHLAILPHDIGACSVADGCGAPRTNSRKNNERKVPNVSTHKRTKNPMGGLLRLMRRAFSRNAEDASFNEIWSALSNALGYDAWVMDFYDGTVVYELWNGSSYDLFQRTYAIDEATLEVTFTSEPEPVVSRVDYVPTEGAEVETELELTENSKLVKLGKLHVEVKPKIATGQVGTDRWGPPAQKVNTKPCGCADAAPAPKGNRMTKEQIAANRKARRARIKAHEATKEDLIEELLDTDENQLTEENRDQLEALPEELLEDMLPAEVLEELEEELEEEEAAAPVANQSLEDYVAAIPDSDAREFILDGIRAQRARRQELIQALTSNKRNELTRDELTGMRTNQLERLHRMLEPEVSYAGRAAPRANNFVEEPLTAPRTHRKEVN